ncbi:Retrovirus-related Pol polyprotein from transposon [Abeliophyllum distichum]|uniref:Retrovirus-related Pol polyprotein from transposon n=1 Tax=Abeliophyllum distichum TaxID=126358 RepID=A0ABD1TKZ9_9LAMI
MKEELKQFMRKSTDIFAWKHSDMVGIDPSVACHALKAEAFHNGTGLSRFNGRILQYPRLEAKPQEVPTWKLYVDGSSGEAVAAAGILLVSLDGHNLNCVLRLEFKASNNATEYEVLLAGLGLALEMKAKELQIYSDSQLVILRIKNGYTDALSKLASSRDFDLMRIIRVEKLGRPYIDEILVPDTKMVSESPK